MIPNWSWSRMADSKELATQTNAATEDMYTKIATMQRCTAGTVAEIAHIQQVMTDVNDLGAFALRPRPGVRGFPMLRLLCPIRLLSKVSGFRMGLPNPTVHSPYHPLRSLPCSLVGLKQDAVGGVLSM